MRTSSTDSGDVAAGAGYPLVTLFLLVTLCGILLGMALPLGTALRKGNLNIGDVLAAAVLASLLLSLLGAMVGLYHHRRLRGIFLGGLVGGMLGLIAGPLCFMPKDHFPHLLVVAVGGSLLLLSIGALVRFGTRGSRVEPPREPPGEPLAGDGSRDRPGVPD